MNRVRTSLAPLAYPARVQWAGAAICAEVAHHIPVDAGEIARLGAIAKPLAISANQAVISEGEAAKHTFLVSTGALRVSRSLPDGRRLITAFLFAGDFLGFTVDGRYKFAVETITPVRLCRFLRPDLEVLLDSCPQLRNALFHFAIEELRLAQDHMVLLGRMSATEKLASFLLHLTWRNARGGTQGKPPSVPLPMTRDDIADHLGLTTETVSRTLAQLRDKGTIDIPTPRSITVLRPKELATLAGSRPAPPV